jgi:hypothetical protein
MNSFITYEFIKIIIGLAILSVIITFLFMFRVLYVYHIQPLKEIAVAMQVGKRALVYNYYTGNLDINTYKPLPRNPLAYEWDGFTILGESVSLNYINKDSTSFRQHHPLAEYLYNKGYSYQDAVWKTSAVVFARVYLGGREIWLSVKR